MSFSPTTSHDNEYGDLKADHRGTLQALIRIQESGQEPGVDSAEQADTDAIEFSKVLNGADGNWLSYNGVDGNRYSAPHQINISMVAQLELKWIFTIPN
ncbi:MAG TPA: hypothetical protein VHQ03_11355, partial [Candidatus Dormibacteraeota bacterium]|nr:hypothetical protein [Candidatus Dormibacteraeota bacterium]